MCSIEEKDRPTQMLSSKEKILEKAGECFWAKGYEKTTMRDLARACGFESPNLYNYFPGKEQILFEVLQTRAGAGLQQVENLLRDETTPPIEQLRCFVKSLLTFTLTQCSPGILFDAEMRNLSPRHRKAYVKIRDDYEAVLVKIICRGVEAGAFNQVDVKIATYSILSIILRTQLWVNPEGRLSADELADRLFAFALNGLAGETKAGNTRAGTKPGAIALTER